MTNHHSADIYPSAILWDMDGVLADTVEIHFQTWHQAMSEFGIEIDRKTYMESFGSAPELMVDILAGRKLTEETRQKIRNRKTELFTNQLSRSLQTTPGIRKWLDHFSKRCQQAVASSAPYDNIIQVLDILEIRHYFHAIVSVSARESKPEPTVFLRAAGELETQPKDCLVFEDSPSGVTAANRAGIPVIAICTTHSASQLRQANLILPNLAELTLDVFHSFYESHYVNPSIRTGIE